MTTGLPYFSPRRLAAWALCVAALIGGLVVFTNATKWRGGANDGGDGPTMQLTSKAQSQRCLAAKGLHVASAGTNSLHVTGAPRVDVTLTFYPTFDQAQTAAMQAWSRSGHGVHRVTSGGTMAGAMDTVAYHARTRLNGEQLSGLFSDCVGHQPAR